MKGETFSDLYCINCKGASIIGIWEVRAEYCPICNPAYRGSSIEIPHRAKK